MKKKREGKNGEERKIIWIVERWNTRREIDKIKGRWEKWKKEKWKRRKKKRWKSINVKKMEYMTKGNE